MNQYQISSNQMAEFGSSKEKGKIRIIKQQLNPDAFRIPWYQLTKARIKKSIENKGSRTPILEAINILQARKPSTQRQISDKDVSIKALNKFLELELPEILNKTDYTIHRSKKKHTELFGVEVIVAPDVIFKANVDGKIVYGGMKVHISKSKPFDLQQSRIVASTIASFLKNEIANKDDIVLHEFCFCLDIFSGRSVSAKKDDQIVIDQVHQICDEIKQVWNAI
jgi:hypothetical protein